VDKFGDIMSWRFTLGKTESWTIHDIVEGLVKKKIDIPEFQRDFVWSDNQIEMLIESIYKGYPIGLIILWQEGKKLYVLDGQQRILSLVLIKEGKVETRGKLEIRYVWFNPEPEKEAFKVTKKKRKPRGKWLNVSEILSMASAKLSLFASEYANEEFSDRDEKFRNKVAENISTLWSRFYKTTAFTVPVYIIPEEAELDDVYQIFTRVNFAGTRLRSTDIYLSLMEIRFPGMSKRVRDFIKELRKLPGKWDLEYSIVTKTFIALLSNGRVKLASRVIDQSKSLNDLLRKRKRDIDRIWETTQHALRFSIKLLRNNIRISGTDSNLMPAQVPLIPLSYYLSIKNFEVSHIERNMLIGWYLLVSFSRRYSSSTDTRLNEDLQIINQKSLEGLIKRTWEFIGKRRFDEEDLTGYERNKYMLVNAILVSSNAKDLKFDRSVTDRDEVHHIFPQSLLEDYFDRSKIDDVANITFVSSETNRILGDKLPREYFNEIPEDRLKDHLIPTDRELLTIDRYEEFLKTRRRLLVDKANEMLRKLNALF